MIDLGILEAKTWFWKPSVNSSGRRSNEITQCLRASHVLKLLGFTVKEDYEQNTVFATRIWRGKEVQVEFYYRESCNKVYKCTEVFVEKQKKTIRILRYIGMEVLIHEKIKEFSYDVYGVLENKISLLKKENQYFLGILRENLPAIIEVPDSLVKKFGLLKKEIVSDLIIQKIVDSLPSLVGHS